MQNKTCFASIDVEKDLGKEEFQGVEKLDIILDVFKKHNLSATLFVTGEVLQKYPTKFQELASLYEIACHSFTHRFWNTLNLGERQAELDKFIELYQALFQKKPIGFRAPSHIIDDDGIKLLEEKGFLYDSSVVPHYPPFKKYRGYPGRAPLLPYYPKNTAILEIPVRGQILGFPLTGAWIRGLPPCFYKVLFSVYSPSFITLNMHSWDILDSCFLNKLDKILKILKNRNYLFHNGEQILKNPQ